MSSLLWSPLRTSWSRSELLDRANRWLRTRGEAPITDSMLLDWKKDGILPRVGARSLGIGRGSAGGWDACAYRQLLRVFRLREAGITRRRDLRVALWLEGFPVRLDLVRHDLDSLFTIEIARINEEMGTATWPALEDSAPTPAARRAIEKHFSSQEAVTRYVASFQLSPPLDSLLQHLTPWALTPAVQRVLTDFAHQLFAAGPGDLPSALSNLTAQLPPQFRPLLAIEPDLLLLHEGMLASPEGFENRVINAIREGPDEELLNVRDLVGSSNRLWSSAHRFAAVLFERQPQMFPSWFVPFVPLAARVGRRLSRLHPFANPGTQVMLFGLFLNRRKNLQDGAAPLGVLGRIGPAVLEFLADRPELLEGSGERKREFEELIAESDLPDEAKAMLAAAS